LALDDSLQISQAASRRIAGVKFAQVGGYYYNIASLMGSGMEQGFTFGQEVLFWKKKEGSVFGTTPTIWQ
jgi:hypothetical protein